MKKSSRGVLISFVISLLIFLAIILFIKNSAIVLLDLKINLFMSVVQDSFLVKLFTFLGIVFDPIAMIIASLLIALFFWKKYSQKDGLFFAIIALVGGAAIEFFKLFFNHVRPFNAIIVESTSSFPSGHAAFVVILFGLLSYFVLIKKRNKLFQKNFILFSVLMMFLMGFSRLYLNVHWFSDVIAGYALGAMILFGSILVKEKLN
jgi:undecaprenyl-diphosphatase